MTLDQIFAEGHRLARPCNFLKPDGSGEPVALWLDNDDDYEDVTGFRRWITLRADALPNPKSPNSVFFTLFTDGDEGLVKFGDAFPPSVGTPLFAHPTFVLPPLDAIFAFGSEEIGNWLRSLGWPRTERPGSNFPEWSMLREYQHAWMSQHPAYSDDPDIYAATGGWHMPTQWNDWHQLAAAKLVLTTIKNAEPWVEVFQLNDSEYKVIPRET